MSNNPEQQRLQALLQFATSAGSHGSPPVGEMITSSGDNRSWLNEAVNHYASQTFNPVEYLNVRLRLIHRYLANSTESDVVDVYNAFEDISETCENCDLAEDLHKIGGYDVVIRSLEHEDCEIRWRACGIIAAAAQNHEYCQNAWVEMKSLPIIIKLIDDMSADKVREKAFYALSCITRGNEKALEELNLNDGFSTIIRAMQSENSKLKIKAVFFIKALCTDDSKYANILHERGIEQQIIGMLHSHEGDDNSDSLNMVENLLGCLHGLVRASEKICEECRDPRFGLRTTLIDMKTQFRKSGSGYDECAKFCDAILEACFAEEESMTTAER